MKRIYCYFEGTKDKIHVLNACKKMVVYCYADGDFVGIWGQEKPQDTICAGNMTVFVVFFFNYLLLWFSKIQTDITLLTLNYEYVALSHSVIDLLPLNNLSKEVIENLVTDSENLKFVSSSNVYEDNNGVVIVKNPGINPTSKQIAIRYYSFRQHVRKKVLIRITESGNQKAYIFTIVIQGELLVRNRKLIYGW